MLKRQLRPAQDFIENVHKCVEVQGLGPWRGLGQRPNLACLIGQWFGRRGMPRTQHQSREAGSCMGR